MLCGGTCSSLTDSCVLILFKVLKRNEKGTVVDCGVTLHKDHSISTPLWTFQSVSETEEALLPSDQTIPYSEVTFCRQTL